MKTLESTEISLVPDEGEIDELLRSLTDEELENVMATTPVAA